MTVLESLQTCIRKVVQSPRLDWLRALCDMAANAINRRNLERSLRRNICPLCHSNAPECDNCYVCDGSREYPLSTESRVTYRRRYMRFCNLPDKR